MSEPLVLVDCNTPGLAVLTLNRPQAMNALSAELLAELARCITAQTADTSVRVLVLTGAGRAFCAGLDLKEIGADAARSAALNSAWLTTTRSQRSSVLPAL